MINQEFGTVTGIQQALNKWQLLFLWLLTFPQLIAGETRPREGQAEGSWGPDAHSLGVGGKGFSQSPHFLLSPPLGSEQGRCRLISHLGD